MDFARGLLSPDGSMRSEQDRKMGFCEFNQIRRRYHRKTTIFRWSFFYCGGSSILTGAQRPFAYGA